VVSDEEVEPPEDSFPNPQDTMADVLSDPPCIDSAPTEHSEPQAELFALFALCRWQCRVYSHQ